MALSREGQPKGGDGDLNSTIVQRRLQYAVDTFRELTNNSDELKLILGRLGHNQNQTPFVARAANFINTGVLTAASVAVRRFDEKFEGEAPGSEQKRIAEGTYAQIDSLGVGFARLKVYAPQDTRVIDGGYVKWGIVSRTEGADLRRLADQSGDFLSLVLVDPSLLEARNFRRFIMAAHPDEPNLQPEPWLGGGILVRFGGETLFKKVQGPGVVGASFRSKDKHWKETWVNGKPSEETEQKHVLVGKLVS